MSIEAANTIDKFAIQLKKYARQLVSLDPISGWTDGRRRRGKGKNVNYNSHNVLFRNY